MNHLLIATFDLGIGTGDLYLTIPLLWITVLALIVLTADLFLQRRSSKKILGWISLGGLIVGLFLNQIPAPANGSEMVFNGAFQVDSLTYFANLVILTSVLISTASSIRYLDRSNLLQGEFFGLLLLSTVGMMLMAGANDFIIFFLGFEIMSIAAYILVGWAKSDLRSGEGSLKYVVAGAFTSAILIYGLILMMASVEGISFQEVGKYLQQDSISLLFKIGLALVIGSFAFKIAAVPFHMWAPDAYRGAPSPVTGFISTGVKVAAIIGFFRVFLELLIVPGTPAGDVETLALGFLRSEMVTVLTVIASLTVLVGNVAAIAYRDVKGILAYSSIAHAGYILIGLTAFFATTQSSIRILAGGAVLFYLFAYTFMNLGAFCCVIYANSNGETRLNLSDYQGLAYEHPWIACSFGLFLISLTGIPLTAGFSGKVLIFWAVIEANHLWLALIGAAGTLISIYYYMRIVVMMFMREPEESFHLSFSIPLTLSLFLTAAGVIALGIAPGRVIDLSRRTILQLI